MTATQYTCSLNCIYLPHWLVQWSHHCLHMYIPVHSPWLPGYIDIMQTILIILTVVGPFPERPHILQFDACGNGRVTLRSVNTEEALLIVGRDSPLAYCLGGRSCKSPICPCLERTVNSWRRNTGYGLPGSESVHKRKDNKIIEWKIRKACWTWTC